MARILDCGIDNLANPSRDATQEIIISKPARESNDWLYIAESMKR